MVVNNHHAVVLEGFFTAFAMKLVGLDYVCRAKVLLVCSVYFDLVGRLALSNDGLGHKKLLTPLLILINTLMAALGLLNQLRLLPVFK
jgi:hypothetical protein